METNWIGDYTRQLWRTAWTLVREVGGDAYTLSHSPDLNHMIELALVLRGKRGY